MRSLTTIIIVFAGLNGICQRVNDMFTIPEFLEYDWRLKRVNDTAWINDVKFPSTIHDILFDKKLIPNPYYGTNESALKWIEESDWIAEHNFIDKQSEFPLKFLIIEGIEPYAKVYINDKLVFESDNAFKKYSFEISSFLIPKQTNKIKILFESPVRRGKAIMAQNKILLPVDERIYTRKSQYEYGWDWGPRFVTTGIRGSMVIIHRQKDYFEIQNAHTKTASFNAKEAVIENIFTVFSTKEQTIFIHYNYYNKVETDKKIKLKKGINTFSLSMPIKDPELWWPSNMGDHRYYELQYLCSLKKYNRKRRAPGIEMSLKHAFCKIELIQENDSIGKSFYFKVNGIPTYAKGFNIIPEDHFDQYSNNLYGSQLVNNLSLTGSNMARVWGGGTYLPDNFYDECLDYGIMVWQDLMFACAMYPGDSTFIKNVKEEISQQVIRLRNYNNIAVWCGNNESDEAWKNWGWQKQFNYSEIDSTKIYDDYKNLFNGVIPSIVNQLSPGSNYISTSPQIGWGHKESLTHGDSHYWGVWWGKEPINTFEKKIPRFMSEFGMQAMPVISTLKNAMPDSALNFSSPQFKNHQKHPTGFETLDHYLKENLIIPTDLENYAYATQVLQAYTLKTAIEAQRRAKPRCMGSLIWQLNDTWPVTSWSVIDYYNQPKLAFQEVNNAFNNLLLTVEETNTGYNIYVVNDDTTSFTELLNFYISTFDGDTLIKTSTRIKVKGNSSQVHWQIKKSELTFDLSKVFLNVSMGDRNSASNNYHFVKPNQLKLSKPQFDITLSGHKMTENLFGKTRPKFYDYYVIQLTAKTYMPYVQILPSQQLPDKPYDFNTYTTFFPQHILPGQKVTFYIPKDFFTPGMDIKEILLENFRSLNTLLRK